jgi:ABC-2 type transport system ATP-binding protein
MADEKFPVPEDGSHSADPPPIRIEGLVKRLGRGVTAVDGLNLVVQAGQVLGLAGPNGAGKSVTLKILLGLVRPTAGRVELFGQPVRPGAPVLGRVGALVDGPGFVPHLSGLRNLELAHRMIARRNGQADLERAVAIAGLGEAIRRPYRTYSHGMRYRLGLAQALLGDPRGHRGRPGGRDDGRLLKPRDVRRGAAVHPRRRDVRREGDRHRPDRPTHG